ncbi:hypothetical protein LTR84_009696 [Exophiala bonariae]|uniref:Clr5 domain-containing protein n=1 Tax=Exophiala bonariae TaxID=1690606 RepID=A0AAV9NMS3_9EURO|nr:hypothetical protein LTR84_009696 [Exophiala bonariae]
MRPMQVVFIHHNQTGGRLSQASTTKAWAHIGKRSWQPRPEHLTFKIWEPQEKDPGPEGYYDLKGQETVTVSFRRLQQAYVAKTGLQNIDPPEQLALVENTLHNAKKHFYRCAAETHPEWDRYVQNFHRVKFSIKFGVDSLRSRNYTEAFALFEYAARLLQDYLTSSALDNVTGFFDSFVPALLYAQFHKAHDVVELFLKQIRGLASISRGPMHPISAIARNLLASDITPDLVQRLMLIEVRQYYSDQPGIEHFIHGMLFEWKCCDLGQSYPIQEAEYTYQYLNDHAVINNDRPNPRFDGQFINMSMALLYLGHSKFIEAAAVLSDVPGQFAEWIERGYIFTTPPTAPLSMTGIVCSLTYLARALAGQNLHESAEAMFRMAIFAGQNHFEPDHPVSIEAMKAAADYFFSQSQKRDAGEMQEAIDARLKSYMLTM